MNQESEPADLTALSDAGDSATAPPPVDWAERLDVFYGHATAGECRLYVRLDGLQAADGWRLVGHVRGPECRYADTLPANYRFKDRGPGTGLLAEAFVPDPCCWSPALPQIYTVNVELRRHDTVCGREIRHIGIRPLGARARKFYWEGKRWVLRAVASAATEAAVSDERKPMGYEGAETEPSQALNLQPWHAGPTAMLVAHPADSLCQQASIDGVLLIARLTATTGEPFAELKRLARWPAVGIAILDDAGDDPSLLRRKSPNIVLAQFFPADAAVAPASWAQAAVVAVSTPADFANAVRDCSLPVIAYQPTAIQNDVAAARADCDLLQADLARYGDFAGYVV